MEKLFEYDSLDGNQANLTKYLGSEAEVVIPAEIDGCSVVCISKGAFQNLTINDLRIPDSVMSVNSHAFEHCNIRNLHIAYNAMVASDSFFDCNIEAATVAKNDESFWTRSLPGTQLHFAEAPIIQEKGFSYYLRSNGTLDLLECTAPVSQIIVPSQCQGHAVKRIIYGLRNCKTLSRIWISEGIEVIGPYPFFGCEKLREIYLPKSVNSIWPGILRKAQNALLISQQDGYTHSWCKHNNHSFLSIDPQLEEGSDAGDIFFEAPQGHEEELKLLNEFLSGMEFLKVSVEKEDLYMQTITTTDTQTGEKAVRYQAGLERCSLWCTPVTTPGSGCLYQISLYAESDETALHARFHQEHPGHVMRLKTVYAYKDKPNGVFILHSNVANRPPVEPLVQTAPPVELKPASCREETIVYDGIIFRKKENGTLDVDGSNVFRKELTIPALVHGHRVVNIRPRAFAGNQALESVYLCSGISGIKEGAFENCTNLTRVTIPASVVRIGKTAFLHCGEIVTKEWVDEYESSDPIIRRNAGSYGPAVYEVEKKECRLQITVTAGSHAEAFCKENRISHTATLETSQELPPQKVMKYTPAPMAVSPPEPKPKENTVTQNGILFHLLEDGTASVQRYRGSASSVTIPKMVHGCKVTRIQAQAFQDCYDLSHVEIPNTITNIGTNAFKNCGRKETVDEDLSRAYTAHSRRDLEYMFGYGYEYYESRMIGGEDPVKVSYELTATVARGSYAEEYCRKNGIKTNPR